jgi:hypothetical protein
LGRTELVDSVLERVDLRVGRIQEIEVAVRDVVDEPVDELAERASAAVRGHERGHVERRASGRRLPDRDEAVGSRDEADLEGAHDACLLDDRNEHAQHVGPVILEERTRVAPARRCDQLLDDVGVGARREDGVDLRAGRVEEVEPACAHCARE